MKNFFQWLVVYISMFLIIVTGVLYTNITQSNTERKFCSIVNRVVNVYEEQPPMNDQQRAFVTEYKILQQNLGCKKEGAP